MIFAACANDLDRIHAYLAAPSTSRFGGRPRDPSRAVDYATIYAAGLGRREAVALLLEHDPDLAFREPVYSVTALEAARYPHPAAGRPLGNPEIVELLVAAGT